MSTSFEKTRLLGNLLRYLSWFLGVTILTIACVRWTWNQPLHLLPPSFVSQFPLMPLSSQARFCGFLIEMIPFVCQLFVLRSLIQIGKIYCQGVVITKGIGSLIQSLAKSLFFLSLANGLYTTLLSALLSSAMGAGALKISFGLSTSDLYLLMSSLAIYSLGRVANEGERLKIEISEII